MQFRLFRLCWGGKCYWYSPESWVGSSWLEKEFYWSRGSNKRLPPLNWSQNLPWNNVCEAMLAKQWFRNKAHETMFIEQRLWNSVCETMFVKQCLWNTACEVMFRKHCLWKCLWSNACETLLVKVFVEHCLWNCLFNTACETLLVKQYLWSNF